jgi:hypothetical protein
MKLEYVVVTNKACISKPYTRKNNAVRRVTALRRNNIAAKLVPVPSGATKLEIYAKIFDVV